MIQVDAESELFVEFDGKRIQIAEATFHSRATALEIIQQTKELLSLNPEQVPIPRLPYRNLSSDQRASVDPEKLYQQHLDALLTSYLRYEIYQEFARQFPAGEYGVAIDAIVRQQHLQLTSELVEKQSELWFDGKRPVLSEDEAIMRMQRIYPGIGEEEANRFVKGEMPSFAKSFVYRSMAWQIFPSRSGNSVARWREWQQVEPLFQTHLNAVSAQRHPLIERRLAEAHGHCRFFFVGHPTHIPDSMVESLGDGLQFSQTAKNDVEKINQHLMAARLKLHVGVISEQRRFAASAFELPESELQFQKVLRFRIDSVPVALYSPDDGPVYLKPEGAGADRIQRLHAAHEALVRPIVKSVLQKARVMDPMVLPGEDALWDSAGLSGHANVWYGTTLPKWFTVTFMDKKQ